MCEYVCGVSVCDYVCGVSVCVIMYVCAGVSVFAGVCECVCAGVCVCWCVCVQHTGDWSQCRDLSVNESLTGQLFCDYIDSFVSLTSSHSLPQGL